jgi:hypothetical protein
MSNKTLNEVMRTSQYLGTALNSIDRELGLAKKDMESGEFQSAENDIYRSRYSLRTAMDEHNTIDNTVRKALKLPEKQYRRINIDDKPGSRLAKNREVTVPLAGPVTYSYSGSKKTATPSISTPATTSAAISKTVDKVLKPETRSVGTEDYTGTMFDRPSSSYFASRYQTNPNIRQTKERLGFTPYSTSGDPNIAKDEIHEAVTHSLGVGSDEPMASGDITSFDY